MNLILGLFLVLSLLVPLCALFFDADTKLEIPQCDSITQSDSYAQYENLVLNQTADNLVQAANELLLTNDIKADNIQISIKKSDDNSIYISSIYIYISEEYKDKAEAVKRIISSNMTKEPVIIVNEENT